MYHRTVSLARRTALLLTLSLPSAAAEAEPPECEPASYECAASHVARHEFAEAIGSLETLLERTPADVKALNLLGLALTGAGRVEEANVRFARALALDAAFVPARKNLAVNEFRSGRVAQARAHLEEVLKLSPRDEVANLFLAEVHYRESRRGLALEHYERSGARVADDPQWTLHHAHCLLEAGRRTEATARLEHLPEDDASAQFQAGVILGEAGAPAAAAPFFGRAARPGFADRQVARYNQTLMLIEAGDDAGAIAVAERPLDGARPSGEYLNLVSRAYLGAGRIEDAYNALRQATRLEPTAEVHYVDLATICMDHDNYDLGLEIVDIGLQYRPDSALLYLQRGVLLAQKAQLQAAEEEFQSARRLAPEEPAPYAALAMVWMQTGQTGRAVEVLREAARLRPDDHVVSYTFAVALLRSGLDLAGPDAEEAVSALRASIRAKPDFAPARSELGRLLLKRNDLDGAIGELERAVALDPDSTAALYNLGQAFKRRGEPDRAREVLARVMRLNARERGDDPEAELKRVVLRLVKKQ